MSIGKIFGKPLSQISKIGGVAKSNVHAFIKVPMPAPISGGLKLEVTVSGDSIGRTVTLPLYNQGVFNGTVNWGDGTGDKAITAWNDPDKTHVYAAGGVYVVEIKGAVPSWDTSSGSFEQKLTDIIYWGDATGPNAFGGFATMGAVFANNPNLKSLGTGKIINAGVNSLANAFTGLPLITSIPAGLLDNLTGVQAFHSTFSGCTSLTSIPTDLFRYMGTPVIFTFASTFEGCTSLTTIPADLFKYNDPRYYGFLSTFLGCTSLTTIPTDLFRYNNNSALEFINTFYGCTNLVNVPADLFRYNTNIGDQGATFLRTFYGCNKLKINRNIFYADGEQTTRFLNKSINFTNCFSRDSWTGSEQGEAPDLWNCSFGSGTPTKTTCFGGAGNSASSISNYSSIPAAWK